VKDFYTLADLRTWDAETRDVKPPIRLGVLGDPVAHSLSPQMQNAALHECGIDMQYTRFQVAPAELSEVLQFVRRLEFVGINLTVPHKSAAVALVNRVDETAQKIGAINSITRDGDQLVGFNTDAAGFLRAVREEFSVDLRNLRVLILGAAGGAGRAIAMQCAFENCERLVLVNRTFEKAQQLARELAPYFTGPRVLGPVARLEAVRWDEALLRFQLSNTDLAVNATPIGMRRSDPPFLASSLLSPHLMIFDATYARESSLGRAAAEAGARYANGLSMLLHQGAIAFERWFDRAPPIEAMRNALSVSAR
jgi:shikimate dehydrogenase